MSWSHYLSLLRVGDRDARAWYEAEAFRKGWSFKTLQRNIYSQYYYNRYRIHSALGYMSPCEYEEAYADQPLAA